MLTWNVTYHTKPGHRDAFYQNLMDLGVRELSTHEEGNLKYDYFFSAEDPNALLLVETWTAPKFQEAHTKTETFARLQACKEEHCESVTIDKFNH